MPYLRRSPSPCRVRTKGTMWPTRLGAWKSRAGGAYLPPTDSAHPIGKRRRNPSEESSRSNSQSPARYAYPDEFKKRAKVARRSPSYDAEPRANSEARLAACSASDDNAEPKAQSRKKKKKRKQRSPSKSKSRSPSAQRERASPVYEPDINYSWSEVGQKQPAPSSPTIWD